MAHVTAEILPQKQPSLAPCNLADQTQLQDAIHAPHAKLRNRIMDTLAHSPDKSLQRQASTMSQCADSLHLYFSTERGEVREYIHTCKARLCPLCGRRRSAHVAAQMLPMVSTMTRPRHLVLTVQSRHADLRSQLTDLVRWFKLLRRTSFWKQNVTQGVYTIEATINERTGLWHPHLHIIFDGQYLPVKRIQFLWHQITDGSEIVWIEEAYSKPGLVQELCKYIGKPQKSEHWTDTQLCEYALAVRGARMVQTFGKRHPATINDAAPPDEQRRDDDSISLSRVIWLALHDNKYATDALFLLAQRSAHLARYIFTMMPQLTRDLTPTERILHNIATIEAGHPPPPKPPPRTPEELKAAEQQLAETLERASCAHDSWYMPAQPDAPTKWSFNADGTAQDN